jgi:predicted RNase H-like HicB family nuclease
MDIKVTTNDDGYLAVIESVKGAFAEGDTPYEAVFNLFDVLDMISEYRNETFNKQKFENGVSFHIPEFA